jgi:hypothetical protein
VAMLGAFVDRCFELGVRFERMRDVAQALP